MIEEEIKKLTKEIEELKERSKSRENLLTKIMESNEPLENFPNPENFLVLAREWNSWYPSSYNVSGGCYFFNLNEEIFIIDPGFNTFDFIIEKNLDIRLIHHVFITHFHPDHFENLVKLITRMTSEEHKLTIYLNPTTLKQFKIYLKANTEFIGLTPGSHVKIKSGHENAKVSITIVVKHAHHREIAGFSNAISLKFILHFKETGKEYKIGFMSDTDGLKDYIVEYIESFDDCDLLIPHIGAIHKEPVGYKHLYLSGIEELFKSLRTRPFIFLGEFGLELSTDEQFYIGLENVISESIDYNRLVKNIIKIIEKGDPENNALFTLLMNKFEDILDNLPVVNLFSLEILMPFINDSLVSSEISLESIFQNYQQYYDQTKFLKFWWSKIKSLVLNHEDKDETSFRRIIPFGIRELDIYFTYVTDIWKERFKKIIPYLKEDFISTLLYKFKSLLIFKRAEFNHENLELITPIIDIIVNAYQFDNHENFNGKKKENFDYFSDSDLISKSFILSIFLIFIQELDIFLKFGKKEVLGLTPATKDGRETICKFLSKKYDFNIIPVHPSYMIKFQDDDVYLSGRCRFYHEVTSRLSNYNHSWKIIREKGEFIDVITEYECPICYEDLIRREIEDSGSIFFQKSADVEYQEYFESVKADIENVSNMNELFQLVCEHESAVQLLGYIRIKDKINNFKKQLDNKLLVLYLIHPFFVKDNDIFNIIKQELKNFSEDKAIDLIKDIFNKSFPYNTVTVNINLELLDHKELALILIEKIENKVDFNLILEFVNFYYDNFKLRFVKNHDSPMNHFFKKHFIETFVPIIEAPERHQKEIQVLKEDYHIISEVLCNLGDPFIFYAGLLSRIIKPRSPLIIDFGKSHISFWKPTKYF